jgi:hypothetical protein
LFPAAAPANPLRNFGISEFQPFSIFRNAYVKEPRAWPAPSAQNSPPAPFGIQHLPFSFLAPAPRLRSPWPLPVATNKFAQNFCLSKKIKK